MQKKTVMKLIESSNAFFFQKDDLGMAELTPQGAMISFSSIIITFVIVAALMGGGF